MKRMENHKFTIAGAFKECFYVVPDYQREYVWTEKQVTQLLEDISEQMDDDSVEYFIGTILVSSRNGEKYHYDVIDGQQRLTTNFLILCALRSLFGDGRQGREIDSLTVNSYTDSQGETYDNLKLELRYDNAGKVMEKIVKISRKGGDPEAVRADIKSSNIKIYGSVKNILDAYDVIYSFLTKNYDDKDRLKKYWGHLNNNVVFIQITTDGVSSALKIFETINERGIGLNSMDLLKNLLFAHILPEEFSQLKDKWKKITDHLEKNKQKPLRFLRYFLMANYKHEDIIREDQIYDWFLKEENAEATGYKKEPFKFVERLTRSVEQYVYFSEGRGKDGKPSSAMDSLTRLTHTSSSNKKTEKIRQQYILLLAAEHLPLPLFNLFVTHLENLLFFYIFTKTTPRDIERDFYILAGEFSEVVEEIISSKNEQEQKLNKFVAEHFAKHMTQKKSNLEEVLKRLTLAPPKTQGSMQKYQIRYLLARLTEHVDKYFRGNANNLDSYFGFDIEHILPNNPGEDLLNAWQENHPESDYDEYKNRLGNLTLLEKPINIVAGNNVYEAKFPEYKKSGNYLTKSMARLEEVGLNSSINRIGEELLAFVKWEPEDIDKRQQMLVKLALDIWKIPTA